MGWPPGSNMLRWQIAIVYVAVQVYFTRARALFYSKHFGRLAATMAKQSAAQAQANPPAGTQLTMGHHRPTRGPGAAGRASGVLHDAYAKPLLDQLPLHDAVVGCQRVEGLLVVDTRRTCPHLYWMKWLPAVVFLVTEGSAQICSRQPHRTPVHVARRNRICPLERYSFAPQLQCHVAALQSRSPLALTGLPTSRQEKRCNHNHPLAE